MKRNEIRVKNVNIASAVSHNKFNPKKTTWKLQFREVFYGMACNLQEITFMCGLQRVVLCVFEWSIFRQTLFSLELFGLLC